MKKLMTALVVSGLLIGCSETQNDLTNKEMVELFLKYVIETQQEAMIAEMLTDTPITKDIYHIMLLDLQDRRNERNRLWREIKKIKELKEEAKEQKAREDKVRNGEYHKDVFYEPIDFDLT